MNFVSGQFWIFFLAVYSAYLVLAHRWQNRLLVIASLFFYASWDWRFVPLLLVCILVSYYSGITIYEAKEKAHKKQILYLTILIEVGILFVFKYFNFFIDSVAALFGKAEVALPFKIILPLGISYYTFQAIAYSVDVYRGKIKPSYSVIDFTLFKSYFPILFCGPIERASNLLVQCERPRKLTTQHLESGVFLITWGFLKKVLIADNIAVIVNRLYGDPASLNGFETWIAVYSFVIQVYCDFSGYTDIARGLGKLMGFEISLNFNLPLLAKNPVDFWRRWHISLATWMRDYIYYPTFFLLKNMYVATVITFVINGIWHGAEWRFVVLGTYWGLVVAGYTWVRPYCTFLNAKSLLGQKFFSVISMVLMFNVTTIAFVFLRAESLTQAADVFLKLLSGSLVLTRLAAENMGKVALLSLPVLFIHMVQTSESGSDGFLKLNRKVQFAVSLAMAMLMLATNVFLGGGRYNADFVYFRF